MPQAGSCEIRLQLVSGPSSPISWAHSSQLQLSFVTGRGLVAALLRARCRNKRKCVPADHSIPVDTITSPHLEPVRPMLVPTGKVLNYAGVSQLTPAEISARAAKILRFIDLGGHERYMKTALYGMTCMVRWFSGQPGAAKARMCASSCPI